MPAAMEIQNVGPNTVLARQGQPAERMFVIQKGRLAGKLVPKSDDDAALAEALPVETWAEQGIIIGAESILAGQYVESVVAIEAGEVLVIPVKREDLLNRLKSSPKIGMSLARSVARKIMTANRSLTASQSRVTRLEQELAKYFTDFYEILNSITKDAEGEDVILDAIKDAKGSKTYTVGRGLSGENEEKAVTMTRVIESYEMQGKQHKLKKGEALCRAGDPGNSMFIVMKGKLFVVIDGDQVGEINAGETVGEIAVILGQNQTRTADLIAAENTVVGIIPGDQFEKLAVLQPVMLLQILASLVKRVARNYAAMADHEAQELKGVTRYLGKPDVDVEKDYSALAEKLGHLIEEFEIPLYREVEILERGVNKIHTLKEKYAHWLPKPS